MTKQSTNKRALERVRKSTNLLLKKAGMEPLLVEVLSDLLWVVDHQQSELEGVYAWTKYIIEQALVDHAYGGGFVRVDTSCHEAIKAWHHTEPAEPAEAQLVPPDQPAQESSVGSDAPLSDAQLDSIRTRIANWLMPQHGDMVALVAEVERLRGKLSEAYALLDAEHIQR